MKPHTRPRSRHNTRAAVLTHDQVQIIRTLHLSGFSIGSISRALGINSRTAWGVTSNRRWYHVPYVPTLPPLLPPEHASQLRVRGVKRLTPEQKQALKQYHQRLELHHDATAETEGRAVSHLRWWTKRVARACEVETTECDKLATAEGYAT